MSGERLQRHAAAADAAANRALGESIFLDVRLESVLAFVAALADSAWPLHLQGAQAGMLALRNLGSVPVQAEDTGSIRHFCPGAEGTIGKSVARLHASAIATSSPKFNQIGATCGGHGTGV